MSINKDTGKIISIVLILSVVLNIIPIIPVYADNTERYTVLALDTSGSMQGVAISGEKTSAIKFCTELLNSNTNSYVALVTYGSSAKVNMNFTNDLDEITKAIKKLSATGGTNTNDALQKADTLLSSAPTGATKNLVLLSDGLPESGSSTNNGPYTSSDSYSNYAYANAAYNTAQKLKQKYNVYTLGFFHNSDSSKKSFGNKFMSDMQNSGYYEVENPDDLDFTFGEIATDITQSQLEQIFIDQHLSYYNGNYDDEILEIVLPDEPNKGNKKLGHVYQDVLDDQGYTMYRVLKLGENFANIPIGIQDELDSIKYEANNYDLILADLVTSSYYRDMINEVAKQTVMNDISVLLGAVIQISGDSLDLIAEDNKISQDLLKKEWQEMASMLDQMNITDDPEKYAELYGKCSVKVDQYVKGARRDEIISKLKGKDGIPGMCKEALEGAFIDTAISTISEGITYVACYDAYVTTTDTCKEILVMSALMTYQDMEIGDTYHAAYYKDAVARFIEESERVVESSKLQIAGDFAKKGVLKFCKSFGNGFIEGVLTKIPYVNIVYKIKKYTGIAFSATMMMVDAFTTLDDRTLAGSITMDCAFMATCLKRSADHYGLELKKASGKEDQFKQACMFDESIRLYKAAIMMMCDAGTSYEQLMLQSKFASKETKSWASTEISIIALERMLMNNIRCHSSDLNWDPEKKTFTFTGKGRMVLIACPVTMTVKDGNGNVIATLSDNKQDVKSGYEAYFHVLKTEPGSKDYMKFCYIPEDWKVSYEAVDNGTMNVITADVLSDGSIQNIKSVEIVPITKGETGTIGEADEFKPIIETDTETTTRHRSNGGGSSKGGKSSNVAAKTETSTEATTLSTNNKSSSDVSVTIGERSVLIGDKSYTIDVAPYIQKSSNSILVPLRFISLAICGGDLNNADATQNIRWEPITKTATIISNGHEISFQAGSNVMIIDSSKSIPMDYGVVAEITNNRMFIPFRALGNALGVNVIWNADTKTAIYSK